MFQRGSIILRVFATLLLVGLLVAAGFMIFRAGQAQGYAMGVAQAANGQQVAPGTNGAPGTLPWMYPGSLPGYWPGYYYRPHFFFGPLFGIFFFFLFFFLIGGLFRRAWGWGRPHGPWGHHYYGPHPHGWGPPPGEPGQQQETPQNTKPAEQ